MSEKLISQTLNAFSKHPCKHFLSFFLNTVCYSRMPKIPANRSLSATLNALLGKEGRSQRWLAAHTSLNISTISLIISGEREASREHIREIVKPFSVQESLGLVVAHLQDELAGTGVDASRILIRQTDGVDLSNLHLDPAFDAHLGVLARRLRFEQENEGPKTRIISDQVEWLSKMIARLEAHEADVYPFPDTKNASKDAEDGAPRVSGRKPEVNFATALPVTPPSHKVAQADAHRRIARLLADEQKRKDSALPGPTPVAPAKADAKASGSK